MTVSKPPAEQPGSKEIVVGKRSYTDNSGPDYQPPFLETVVAVTSLALYTAWPYILLILILFVWFPPVFLLNVVLYSTLLMPAQVYWAEFLNWGLFRTWREYFSFSYKTTEVCSQPAFIFHLLSWALGLMFRFGVIFGSLLSQFGSEMLVCPADYAHFSTMAVPSFQNVMWTAGAGELALRKQEKKEYLMEAWFCSLKLCPFLFQSRNNVESLVQYGVFSGSLWQIIVNCFCIYFAGVRP